MRYYLARQPNDNRGVPCTINAFTLGAVFHGASSPNRFPRPGVVVVDSNARAGRKQKVRTQPRVSLVVRSRSAATLTQSFHVLVEVLAGVQLVLFVENQRHCRAGRGRLVAGQKGRGRTTDDGRGSFRFLFRAPAEQPLQYAAHASRARIYSPPRLRVPSGWARVRHTLNNC